MFLSGGIAYLFEMARKILIPDNLRLCTQHIELLKNASNIFLHSLLYNIGKSSVLLTYLNSNGKKKNPYDYIY